MNKKEVEKIHDCLDSSITPRLCKTLGLTYLNYYMGTDWYKICKNCKYNMKCFGFNWGYIIR